MFIRAERATSLVLGVYATLVVSLLGLLPFWLDEVLQLAGTHPGATSADVIRYVPQNPGGVPLGYLVQHWVLEIGGLSRWTARVTAAVFGVASCAAVGALAAWLGLRMAWVAVLLFATLPLILRYSTEGRPYSFALFLSVAATLAFIRFAREQSPPASFVTYLILLVAGLYTQPFTILVGAGHGIWAVWERRWRLALATGAAVSIAALSFVPWLLYARGAWRSTIAANQFQFVWTARTPLMILREFSGAGYWGSGLLIVLALIGYRSNQLRSEQKLLLCIIGGTLAGGFAADAVFGYFIAIRQFIWMIPAITVLAAAGIAAIPLPCRLLVTAALIIVCVHKAFMYYSEPKEDWGAAADALRSQLDRADCFVVSPPDWEFLYAFFRPELHRRVCGAVTGNRSIVAVVTPYTTESQRKHTAEQLTAAGYTNRGSCEVGRSQLLVFSRTP